MFDKLDDLLIRFEELMSELQEPDVANDQNRFRKLMKEQSDLAPIVEAYNDIRLITAYACDIHLAAFHISSETLLQMPFDSKIHVLPQSH